MTATKKEDILFSIKQNVGFITLNRPEALNALHPDMMTSIRQHLIKWRDDDTIQVVIIHSNSDKAFCAGGDLKAVYKAGLSKNFDYLEHLFREEYLLNYEIATYPKPYIAFIDGIVMGGGIGLCVHGSYRLMSENTIAAMPESKIGYFPDIGATAFLNKAPGKAGLYLGLTGNTLSPGDALYAGIGTHFLAHDEQADLLNEITNLEQKTASNINELIETDTEKAQKRDLQNHQHEIDSLFEAPDLKGIFSNLEQSSSSFAKETLNILKTRSPSSLAVTFEQLKRGANLNTFAEIMCLEFDLSQNFVRHHDFFEGIRAVVIDKDQKPTWSPTTLDELSTKEIETYFTKHPKPLLKIK